MTETWLPSTDGVVTRLTGTIRELVLAGHEVLVIAPRGKDREGRDVTFPGAMVKTVPAAGLLFLYGGQRWGVPLPRVGRFIREFDPDVVHVVNPACLGIAGVLAARRQHRPLVASYHTDLTQHVPHYRLTWLIPVIWSLLRALHGCAAVNLATSETAIANLAAHGISGVRLWPRAVDLALFGPTNRPANLHPSRKPVALYVGRLAAEKGLQLLAPLADPASGVDLVLVGDGPQRLELARRFRSGSARFTGTLHGPALAEVYAQADVFVFPSTSETLGLVLLEALASGLPVIAADSPASRELLADCPIARIFAPDKPEELLALLDELGSHPPDEVLVRTARRQAAQWSWPRATATLLECYRDVLSGSPVERVALGGPSKRWPSLRQVVAKGNGWPA